MFVTVLCAVASRCVFSSPLFRILIASNRFLRTPSSSFNNGGNADNGVQQPFLANGQYNAPAAPALVQQPIMQYGYQPMQQQPPAPQPSMMAHNPMPAPEQPRRFIGPKPVFFKLHEIIDMRPLSVGRQPLNEDPNSVQACLNFSGSGLVERLQNRTMAILAVKCGYVLPHEKDFYVDVLQDSLPSLDFESADVFMKYIAGIQGVADELGLKYGKVINVVHPHLHHPEPRAHVQSRVVSVDRDGDHDASRSVTPTLVQVGGSSGSNSGSMAPFSSRTASAPSLPCPEYILFPSIDHRPSRSEELAAKIKEIKTKESITIKRSSFGNTGDTPDGKNMKVDG